MCAYIGQKCVWGPVWAAAQLQLVWTTAWKLRKTDWLSFFFSPLSTSSSLPASHTNWWVGGPATRVRESYNKTDGHIHNAAAPTRPFFFFFWKLIHQPVCFIFLSKKKSEAHLSPSQMIPHHHRYNIRERNLLEGQVGNWIFFFCMSYKLFFTI